MFSIVSYTIQDQVQILCLVQKAFLVLFISQFYLLPPLPFNSPYVYILKWFFLEYHVSSSLTFPCLYFLFCNTSFHHSYTSTSSIISSGRWSQVPILIWPLPSVCAHTGLEYNFPLVFANMWYNHWLTFLLPLNCKSLDVFFYFVFPILRTKSKY